MSGRQVKVLVVDEQEIVQIGLRALFASCGWVSRSFAAVDPVLLSEILADLENLT